MDGVAVEPRHTYVVSVYNLPEPEIGDYRSSRRIAIPGELAAESTTLKPSLNIQSLRIFYLYMWVVFFFNVLSYLLS